MLFQETVMHADKKNHNHASDLSLMAHPVTSKQLCSRLISEGKSKGH